MTQDILRFENPDPKQTKQCLSGWTGPWPPPSEMWAVVTRSGVFQPFDPKDHDPATLEVMMASPALLWEAHYELGRHSVQGEWMREASNACRGAEYKVIYRAMTVLADEPASQ